MGEISLYRRVECRPCNRYWKGEEPYTKSGPSNCPICKGPRQYSPWFGSKTINGRTKPLSSHSNDKQVAKAILEEKFEKLIAVPGKKAQKVFVWEAIEEFLAYCVGRAEKGLTPSAGTTSFYKTYLHAHFLAEFGNKKVIDVTHEGISDYLNNTRSGALRSHEGPYRKNHGKKRIAPNTVKNERSAIRRFFTWCLTKKYVAKNPASKIVLDIPKKEQDRNTKELFALTKEQIEAVLKEAQRTMIRKRDGKAVPLYRPHLLHFLRLGFNTGMRNNGLKTLMWEEVFWEEGLIKKYSKGDVLLKIPITPTIKKILFDAAALEAGAPVIACPKTGLVMKSPKTGKAIRVDSDYGLQRACKNAGIKRHVTDHIFRHTFATLSIAGAKTIEDLKQIAAILGHADLELLKSIYTHENKERQAEIMEAMAIDIAPLQIADWTKG